MVYTPSDNKYKPLEIDTDKEKYLTISGTELRNLS